jgi:hypothetical protein
MRARDPMAPPSFKHPSDVTNSVWPLAKEYVRKRQPISDAVIRQRFRVLAYCTTARYALSGRSVAIESVKGRTPK